MFLVPILIAGCTKIDKGGNPCGTSGPSGSSNRPIVCVDDSALNSNRVTANPDEAHAKRNAPIKWFTTSGQGGLSIAFANEDCVRKGGVTCNGDGSSCSAQLTGAASPGTRCKYSISIARDGKTTTQDPIIIIDDGVYDPMAKE